MLYLLFRCFKVLTRHRYQQMCFSSANESYRKKCVQYAPKIKMRISTLALEYDWPETRYMGKKWENLEGGFRNGHLSLTLQRQ